MTTITKLQLQGVRSYSDSHPEYIEFFRPLTIILGRNGCGKVRHHHRTPSPPSLPPSPS